MKKPKLYEQKDDNCWQISLCNYFGLPPTKVPNFLKLYDDDYIHETRKWLNKKGKTITYVPFESFLDTGGIKRNRNLFPEGKCIVCLDDGDDESDSAHACLMIDGELYQKDEAEFKRVLCYYIIHDLY